MKYSTKHNRGVTELLIVIPLFLGLICIVGWLGFLLIAKSKMEKHAWLIQTKKSYDLSVDPQSLNNHYEMNNDFSWRQLLQGRALLNANLPYAFRGYVAAATTQYKKLKLKGDAPSILQNFDKASFGRDSTNVFPYSFEADLIISKTPFNDSWIVKNGMWQEAMKDAGFGVLYPLYLLGTKELLNAAIPGAKMAGFADFINMSDSEIEQEVM